MKNLHDNSEDNSKFARRTFLGAAAGALSATALTLAPGAALAKSIDRIHAHGAPATLAVHYWDGVHFVPAESLHAGDSSLGQIQVRMQSAQEGGLIQSIDSHHGEAIFHALTPAPRGVGEVLFTTSASDLKLTANLREESLECSFTTSSGPEAKLREGTYVLAPAKADLSALMCVPASGRATVKVKGSDETPSFEHVVLTIARA